MIGSLRWLLAVSLYFTAISATASDILGPPLESSPTVVNIGFYLSEISAISEEDETLEFEGILSLSWRDPRQAFDPQEAGYDEKFFQGNYQFSEVFNGWWPQIILANESGKYERQGVMLRIAPDGLITYIEEIDAIAEARMDLRRFPFDQQKLYAMFEVLGFDEEVVVLRDDPSTSGTWDDEHHRVHVPQWGQPIITTRIIEYDPVHSGATSESTSAFVLGIELHRDPGYMIRLVLFPLTVLVALSWSVFWMSRSSLGDRMDISFIGILTIVAYQITISDLMPKISYTTVLSAYLIISFLMISASVVVNLVIGRIDQGGHFERGDRIDLHCRWIFPLTYVAVMLIVCGSIYWAG